MSSEFYFWTNAFQIVKFGLNFGTKLKKKNIFLYNYSHKAVTGR